MGFLIIVLLVLSILYGRLLSGVISAKSLREENEKLQKYNAKVVELERELQEYRRFARRVAELAGIEPPLASGPILYGEDKDNPQKRETNLALSSEKVYPSSKNTETGTKFSIHGESGRSSSDLSSSVRFGVKEKVQIESDSLRRIPKGQPVDGWITRGFSSNRYVFGGEHTGVDLAAKEGTEVRVTADGTITFAGWDDVYGNLAVVDHKNGYVTYYGHNSKILVNPGDFVKRGQVIALSGNSGISSAPHLHYEIKKDNLPVDPREFLNSK